MSDIDRQTGEADPWVSLDLGGWLESFDKDFYAFWSIVALSVAGVMRVALPEAIKAWKEDRQDQRRFELTHQRITKQAQARRRKNREEE